MEDLKILSEITTRYGNRNVNELEFRTPEDFKKYKAKHKMRPGTVVKVAGKDKVVGEPKGKKSKSKPMPQPSDFGGDMDKYFDALNKRMKDDEKSSPKKAKRQSVPLDFQLSNEKEIRRMAKKAGLEVDSIEGNPNAGFQAQLTGDEEALKKFMTSDDYGMDDDEAKEKLKDDGSDAEAKGFNGVDYEKMKGKEPGAFDRNAVSNLLSGNPELEKELGVKSSDDYDKQRDVLGKLDLEKISKIIDKYGDDDDKESHIERLKDDHGLESESDSEERKPYSARDEIDDAIDDDESEAAMELIQSEVGFKNMGKDGKEAKKLLDRLADAEYALIDLSDKEKDKMKARLKQITKKHIKESKISKLAELSKITTRYNK